MCYQSVSDLSNSFVSHLIWKSKVTVSYLIFVSASVPYMLAKNWQMNLYIMWQSMIKPVLDANPQIRSDKWSCRDKSGCFSVITVWFQGNNHHEHVLHCLWIYHAMPHKISPNKPMTTGYNEQSCWVGNLYINWYEYYSSHYTNFSFYMPRKVWNMTHYPMVFAVKV